MDLSYEAVKAGAEKVVVVHRGGLVVLFSSQSLFLC